MLVAIADECSAVAEVAAWVSVVVVGVVRRVVVETDAVRFRALRLLLELVVRPDPRPLALAGREDELRRMIERGASPEEMADTLDLSADEVIASLWRLSQ